MNKDEKIIKEIIKDLRDLDEKTKKDYDEIYLKLNSSNDDEEIRKLLLEKRKIRKFQNEENDQITFLENKLKKDKRIDLILDKLEQAPQLEEEQKTKKIDKTKDIVDNFDKYYINYINHRKKFNNISYSSIKGYNASIRYLKYFIKKDTIFNFKFFKDIQKEFQNLPKNFFKYKKYYSKTYEELLKIKELENYETLNTKTINNHINSYSMLFKYLQYEEIIEENPLNNMIPLVEEIGTNKEEYTKEDLERIFNSNMEKQFKNMCLVVLYTGLRLEEVLSIKKINIEDNLIKIDLKSSSTKTHERIIPIHKNLISSINFQKRTNKGNFLFFNGNIDNEVKNVGKRINRQLKLIIEDKSKTFHSLRKNFSQMIELDTNAEDSIKKYLMGHSFSKDVTHNIYNRGKVNITKLFDCINQIKAPF